MAVNLIKTSKKLMQAITMKSDRMLTFSMKQIRGREDKIITLYIVCENVYNPDLGKYQNVEIYSSSSMIRITMYLRDVWDILNGIELPTDQEIWNDVREGLIASGQYRSWYVSEQQDG